MDDLVTTRTKVNSKVEEILDLTGRIKVLENNCQYLNERLLAAQRQHLDRTGSNGRQQSPRPGSAHHQQQQPKSPNSHRGGGLTFITSPTSTPPTSSATLPTAITSSSSKVVPASSSASPDSIPTDAVTLRAFLQQASQAADELKREALHLPALLKTKGSGGAGANLSHNSSVPAHRGATTSSTDMYTSSPYFTPSEHKSVFENTNANNRRKKMIAGSSSVGGQLKTPGFRGSGTGGVVASPQPLRSKSAMM